MARVPFITAAMQLTIILLLSDVSEAFFRHLCHGEVGMGRIDPIVTPNQVSQHVHGIHGAQSKFLPDNCNTIPANISQTWRSTSPPKTCLPRIVLVVQFARTSLSTGLRTCTSSTRMVPSKSFPKLVAWLCKLAIAIISHYHLQSQVLFHREAS